MRIGADYYPEHWEKERWKTDAEKMGGKKDILDSRFNTYLDDSTQLTMIPRTSDGQLLFLLNKHWAAFRTHSFQLHTADSKSSPDSSY